MKMEPIKPSVFYGEDRAEYSKLRMEKTLKNAERYKYLLFNRMPQKLMGPTQFWQQFPRQAEALETAEKQSEIETVCTFVYQKESGYREFIVAHPEVFWFYTSRMSNESRCFYEVIPEGAPCWLYFDLEFKLELNPGSDGPRMTDTVIKIFCSYIEKYWGLSWDEKNVVNLDSTTRSKFSRHLIFCRKDVAFCNNIQIGSFVKGVCKEVEEYLENSSVLHDVLSHYDRKELEQLFVETDKGKKIFIDTLVYSRNRHFRIYKSTKWGKLSNLLVAPESKHVPLQDRNDKQLAIFLDSLISFFPDKKNLSILEIKDIDSIGSQAYSGSSSRVNFSNTQYSASLYPELDKFILSLVKPGKIRLSKYYEQRRIIVYEILGNRYCANIGREHKSNNVFWTVDLRTKKVYQRCHDEDCADFVSAPKDIPLEVSFHIDDEEDELFLDIAAKEDNQCDISQF
ncbi:DNA-directed primase/polymerase protein-like [Venturia canescens]|uniref:DNA-directed primase/polymerase protein-like n=1 Tax=Venturia canescens TaxID=32260 RepID=UPI001C9D541A|nr:DNA-directed primase/polymerase protein-like [Venturia canescens]